MENRSSQAINLHLQSGLKMEPSPSVWPHWQDCEVYTSLIESKCHFLIEGILPNCVMVLVSLNNDVFECHYHSSQPEPKFSHYLPLNSIIKPQGLKSVLR